MIWVCNSAEASRAQDYDRHSTDIARHRGVVECGGHDISAWFATIHNSCSRARYIDKRYQYVVTLTGRLEYGAEEPCEHQKI